MIFIAENDNFRIDKYLSEKIPALSRSYITVLIRSGRVLANGKPAKASYKVIAGDIIDIDIPVPEASPVEPQDISIDIVFEDQWIAVINKPQGMVVHPAPGHKDKTLVNALLHHYKDGLSDINGVLRPGIVHRIDKDTSGLLMIIKDNSIHAQISDLIANHQIKRTYYAIACGIFQEDSGTMDFPIGRNPNDRVKMAVVRNGKPSITHFEVLERFQNFTLLKLELETGRTHQIRVHLAEIGHPILGDEVYGGKRKGFKLSGQALHAIRLEFKHPITGHDIIVEAPLPDYFNSTLNNLRNRK